jgi:hypothetical protein
MAFVVQDPYGTDPSAQMASPPIDIGDEPVSQPLWSKALGDINVTPITVGIGYQGFRGARTITRGGWATDANDMTKTRFREKFNPNNWTRFKNAKEFTHEGFINKMFRNTEKGKSGIIGRRLEGEGRLADWAAGKGLTTNGVTNPIWSRNLIGRTTAYRRLGGRYTSEMGQNTSDWISRTAPDMAENLTSLGDATTEMLESMQSSIGGGAIADAGGFTAGAESAGGVVFEGAEEAQMATLMAGKGVASQWLSGAVSHKGELSSRLEDFGRSDREVFMKGREWATKAHGYGEGGIKGMWEKAQAQALEKTAGKEVAETAGKEVLETAGKKVVEDVAAKGAVSAFAKMGIEWGASQVIDWIPFVGQAWAVASTAYMAYQVAKTGATLVKDLVIDPAAKMVQQGFNSFKGQIDKSPFGMGYRDNTVAATSRARGVQAIQNSRLNARSVLGSEAGMMHAHFG